MSRPLCIAIAFVLSGTAVAQAQSLRRLHTFDPATEGTSTAAPLMQASDGLFYGVNRSDGPHAQGTLFRMTPNGTLLVLHEFTGGDDGGRRPGHWCKVATGIFMALRQGVAFMIAASRSASRSTARSPCCTHSARPMMRAARRAR